MVKKLIKEIPSGILLTWISGVLSILLLFVMIAKSPSQLRYDEPYHLDLAKSIESNGLRDGLLDPRNQSAAGPLYAGIHYVLKHITNQRAPDIRWVNAFLLVTAIVFLAFTKSQAGSETSTISCPALAVMGVPFLWPSAGMALTEVPALTFFCAFLFIIRKLFSTKSSGSRFAETLSFAIAAGILLGLAILGRQTYLVVIPVLFLLFLAGPVRPWLVGIIVAFTFLVSAWIFWIWGGLVPPSQAKVNEGLHWEHGLFSLAYVATGTAVLSPRWLLPKNRRLLFPIGLLGACLAALSREYGEPPAKSLLIHFFGPDAGLAVGFLVFACMGAFGLYWLINTCMQLWQRREDSFQVFCGLILLALVLAPVKISHLFSSRYVVGLLGVLLIVLQPSPSKFLAARILVGSLVGAVTLYLYYYP